MSEEPTNFEIETELGELKVSVRGDDAEEVWSLYERALDRQLQVAEDATEAIRDGSAGCY